MSEIIEKEVLQMSGFTSVKSSELYLGSSLDYLNMKEKLNYSFANITRSFLTVGYFLKEIRDKSLYKLDQYDSVYTMASELYKLNPTSVNNFIGIVNKFCLENTNKLKPEYSEYNLSQLVELLSVNEDKLLAFTPDLTIKEIREIKKASSINKDAFLPFFKSIDKFMNKFLIEYAKHYKKHDAVSILETKHIDYSTLEHTTSSTGFNLTYKLSEMKPNLLIKFEYLIDTKIRQFGDDWSENTTRFNVYVFKEDSKNLYNYLYREEFKTTSNIDSIISCIKEIWKSDEIKVKASAKELSDHDAEVISVEPVSKMFKNDKLREEHLLDEKSWELIGEFKELYLTFYRLKVLPDYIKLMIKDDKGHEFKTYHSCKNGFSVYSVSLSEIVRQFKDLQL